jgi:hypothetical protein
MPKLATNQTDPGIPTLAAVLDPVELARQLSALLGWDTSQGIRLRVLRWKRASRCTLEIASTSSSGPQELIGKVFAEDRSDVYQAMQEIWRAGFGEGAEFAIPRPVAFVEPLRLLLCEKVPGAKAQDLVLSASESDRVLAAERCARWLVRFQTRGPRLGRVVHLNDHLIPLDGWWRCVADLGRPSADKACRLFEHLKASASTLGSIETCAAHGMYTSNQLILAGTRTVTIDWDTYMVADPCHDVARFVVALQRMTLRKLGSLHALDGVAEVFVKTYLAEGRSDAETRLPFHKAAIFLERAKRDVGAKKPGWRETAEAMLDEGLHALGLD